LGSLFIIALLVIPVIWWWNCGESFLSLTRRLPAEILVVEGWIGRDAVRAARAEFEQHGYRYVVTTGGPASENWEEDGSNYADLAGRELIRLGVPQDRVILAPAVGTERQRTYESAVTVWRALQARGMRPRSVNVFTLGPHSRRSCLVFAKVLRPKTKVGVVGWAPSSDAGVPWWKSSERAKNLLTETAGYLFEALLNSGRGSNSTGKGVSLTASHLCSYVSLKLQSTRNLGATSLDVLESIIAGWKSGRSSLGLDQHEVHQEKR
jgi:uncharacterized SAM-binding protein YcdF (DUF218 family)